MMKTNRISIAGMALFCSFITWASSPVSNQVPVIISAYDFTTNPSGVVATIEFDTDNDRHYSVHRGENLVSNDWNTVASDLSGTGSNIVYQDLAPLSALAHYYKATSTSAPRSPRWISRSRARSCSSSTTRMLRVISPASRG